MDLETRRLIVTDELHTCNLIGPLLTLLVLENVSGV